MPAKRICVVGDELISGMGDARGMGWLGRVLARTKQPADMQVFPLAVPAETTTALSARWEQECFRRFSVETENYLIVQLGKADLEAGISAARTRLNLANILDTALQKEIKPLVIGPPPLRAFDMRHLQELSKAGSEVCERRTITYINTFQPLINHSQWHDDLSLSPQQMPSQTGYGLMAWIILHCGWYQWIGLEALE
ncbi:GDSL-type esterase/lipase family protein [Gleimia sp. 6138-11-ORH1]|uniref:GDSL-type esterase/lipase family protein n=1 Tax=Gleimia sp. 6138-11-ORH1 TaxID=2973937 RepID=UPI00216845A7|nr:GDSL-type esterase/lipase family protein [Gleimia sp. 6138-11-ORH1]MCS4484074.1 GDSL-type esterase/lipase family protein [Gleimia sp. 6138-11-ORH1]